MRKLSKGILWALGGLFGLAIIGMLGINLYVESAGTHARIERELSSALGTPVHMVSATVTPWSGLKINGIAVPQADGEGDFLKASSVAAFFQFWPLFHRQLIVDEIAVNQPQVAWIQSAGEKWRLPAEEKIAAVSVEKPPKPEVTAPEPAEKPVKTPFTVTVKHFRVNRGSFEFFDQKRKRLVSFADVKVDGSSSVATGAEGSATSNYVSLQDTVSLQNLRAPFRFVSGQLLLNDVSADLAGGTLGGGFALQTDEKRSPFTVDLKFTNVDLNQLLSEAGALSGQISGAATGWLDLYGHAGDPQSVGGSGYLTLVNGRMQQYELFQMLGQALQIPELTRLDLQQAQVGFRVGEGSVQVDEILMRSPNIKLTAHGDVRFDGALRLDARLTINQRISRQLPAFVETNFLPGEEPDTRYVDFAITGTVSKPRADLMDRILGRKIQKEVGALFQNIFGGKRKPDEKKKEKKAKGSATDMASPSPSATASPSPVTVE
ncbi:MAG: hypothetical protein QOD99_2323 [Chthoniobacter sp.]|nr:hypothetical protein [Chthoniobacter sp.]